MAQPELKKTIGVGSAVFTLVGFVIGIAIFVLPGELAAKAGPGVFVAYLIAGVLALFSCVVAAQVGALFPMTGAGYVAASRVIAPFVGFMLVWMVMVCMVVGLPILAYGFADYLDYFIPHLNRTVIAVLAVILFGGINLLGVELTVWIQALMVAALVLVLLIFGMGGLAHVNPRLMHPLFPNGYGPLLEASMQAYYSYAGFMVIIEMSGEIERPQRTIPISLAISFLIILTIYVSVAIALPGIIPWNQLAGEKAPLARASEVFLPKGFGRVLAFSALFGAGTAMNAWFLTQTRDFFAMAKDGILPATLARVSRRHGAPNAAVVLAILISLLGVSLGASLEEYVTMVVLALMLIQMFAGVVMLMAPWRVPERYEHASFKLGILGRWFFGLGFIVLSFGFGVIGFIQSLKASLVFIVLTAAGMGFYFLRKRYLQAAGVDIGVLLKKIEKERE